MHPAIEDLLSLLRISGQPGDEAAVAEWLRNRLIALGVPSGAIVSDRAQEQSEYGGKAGNLIVRLDGSGRGKRRMFSAHMDTVPIAVGAKARLDGEFIVNDAPEKALGGDNRTGCAILLHVARLLCNPGTRPGPPTTLVLFVQEEVGLIGARGLDVKLLGDPTPAFCYNFDGSRTDEVVTQVTGTERFIIEIEGIPAHAGAHPERGVSAAVAAANAIHELARDGWHGAISKPSGKGSANVGIMKGGSGSNVVMPDLYILAEARSHDPAFRKSIVAAWKSAFERAVADCKNAAAERGRVRFSPGPSYESFALSDDAEVVRNALAGAEKAGIQARCVSNNGGMDANWIVAHGIPAVTFGAGQQNVHTPAERVVVDEFLKACRLAEALAAMP
jgi:tripeptide aminopeptidase